MAVMHGYYVCLRYEAENGQREGLTEEREDLITVMNSFLPAPSFILVHPERSAVQVLKSSCDIEA